MELKEVAERLEVKPQTINSWKQGKRPLPQNRADQLSEIFNDINPAFFMKELTPEEMDEIQLHYRNTEVYKLLQLNEVEEELIKRVVSLVRGNEEVLIKVSDLLDRLED
ncbi:XRE family transcriptional regulator [Bacillus infantis]|uniref:helix-turn-helix domain-containing protein n=1 Tax=Bacillus infantis TaxID=324767 RepID=UPI00101BD768|nr:helix-turn-helix transcriptional regulator [Bacillus infantis]RYI25176.1 XRE family transcriptional regulator [Bacillus infantis]